jgi:hypothetical protein
MHIESNTTKLLDYCVLESIYEILSTSKQRYLFILLCYIYFLFSLLLIQINIEN